MTTYTSRTSLTATRSLCSLPKQKPVLLVCCHPLSQESVPPLLFLPSFSFKIQCLPLEKMPSQWLFQNRLIDETLSTRGSCLRERRSLIQSLGSFPISRSSSLILLTSKSQTLKPPTVWGIQPLPVIAAAEQLKISWSSFIWAVKMLKIVLLHTAQNPKNQRKCIILLKGCSLHKTWVQLYLLTDFT